jgi:hypothetical protein
VLRAGGDSGAADGAERHGACRGGWYCFIYAVSVLLMVFAFVFAWAWVGVTVGAFLGAALSMLSARSSWGVPFLLPASNVSVTVPKSIQLGP